MRVNLGNVATSDVERLQRMANDIETAFLPIPENMRFTYDFTLDFAAPGSVPGFTSKDVSIDGVELGDTVLVGASITTPAGFMPPVGFVSAADTVTIRWLQVTGAAANPDGAGAVYTIDIFRH